MESIQILNLVFFNTKDAQGGSLARRIPTVSYALVPAGAKLAHFGVLKEIVRDWEIVEGRG